MDSTFARNKQSGSPTQRDLSEARSVVSTETPPPVKQLSEEDLTCPRCGDRLINPESLGLCQGCGYLRTLEEKVDTAEIKGVVTLRWTPAAKNDSLQPARKTKVDLADLWRIVKCSPSWLWGLLTGLAVIGVGSLVADRFLPQESLARALWATIQVAVCLALAFGTQFYAVLRVSADDASLGGASIFIFSGRVWALVFRQLPATRWLVWLETWSLSAAAFAILGIGGFGYWWGLYHPHEVVNQELAQAAATWKPGETATPSKPAVIQAPIDKIIENSGDARPTMQLAIIGYVPDEDNKPQSLITARLIDNQWVQGGIIRRGLLPAQALELRDRLGDLVQFSPQIPGLIIPNAVWVKPSVFCTVYFSGTTKSGDLIDPSFKEVLTNLVR
ncbi:MAG TPA: hypothetical protein VGZ25_03510 [Gemmataceae bacterium]|nr:hypothetical protein [Gemmataceae bacterium]